LFFFSHPGPEIDPVRPDVDETTRLDRAVANGPTHPTNRL
jgi:hypothetical protein